METDLIRVAAPLRLQVEEAIRSAIRSGELSAGDRLVERELCERFGVSRPLLREALRRLEAERLVEISPNRGAHVVVPTLEDAIDLCQVRAELEGLAASLVAQVGTDAAVAELGVALEELDAAVAQGDPETIRKRKNAFYDRLVEACGNRVLSETLRSLHNRIQLFRGAALAEAGRAEAATAELRGIFEAIVRRDPRTARERTALHLHNAARTLAVALARAEGKGLTEGELSRIDVMPGYGALVEEKKV